MFNFKKQIIVYMAILMVMFFSIGLPQANDQAGETKLDWVVQMGLDFGGDTLAKAKFKGGGTDTIKAGEGLWLTGGIVGIVENFETQFTIGYKFDSSTASNGSMDFSRIPVELLWFYNKRNDEGYFSGTWRFGGGITYHINPELKGDGAAKKIDAEFDNALGFILEAGVIFQTQDAIKPFLGLRYTFIDYEIGKNSADGNCLGFLAGIKF